MIIGFLFSTLVFPVTVVFVDACPLINPSSVNSVVVGGILPAGIWSQVSVCFAGNGDLYSQYGLNSSIAFANSISQALSNVSALYNSTTGALTFQIDDLYVGNV
jgi:hypothetical protein